MIRLYLCHSIFICEHPGHFLLHINYWTPFRGQSVLFYCMNIFSASNAISVKCVRNKLVSHHCLELSIGKMLSACFSIGPATSRSGRLGWFVYNENWWRTCELYVALWKTSKISDALSCSVELEQMFWARNWFGANCHIVIDLLKVRKRSQQYINSRL